MRETRYLGTLATAIAVIFVLAGCSHAVFPQTGGSSGSTSPVILTLHDAPPSGPSGVTVTSFEVTITGAVLQPGNVSLLSTPQTVELTQLQTNSILLPTTQVAQGTYTSLTITYASPQYTFLNDSGVSVTVNGQACPANASCVVSNPTATNLTGTATFSPTVAVGDNQTLIEADVNLNDIIQSDFSLNFSQSAGATVTQSTNSSGTVTTLGTMEIAGQVSSVTASSTQFQLLASTGQTFTITAGSGTDFEFARANCTANDFTCITAGEIVDVAVNIQSDGVTLDAGEVDYDDASGTQQVSGTIVAQAGTPPTSVLVVVHNTIPPVSSLPPGTGVVVNIGSGTSYVINSGSFMLPSGLSFASTSDVIVGQEVEARVASNSSIANDAFTTDRLALEQTQLEAIVSAVDSQVQPYPYFILSPLPALFSSAPVDSVFQLEVVDTSANQSAGTVYQDLTPANIGGLVNGQYVTTGGFLFNTTGSVGSPSIIATIVRGEVPGT
ncbi:MAG: hypothetical protein WA020_04450 [Candidatus Acidiferrales bacterium]